MPESEAKRVCIVGSGLAGLITAKVMRDDGFNVVVFEKADAIGGVWHPSRTYPELTANNPRETYTFSELPYPKGTDDYPTAEQIRVYIDLFADRFELRPLIRLSSEVDAVSRVPAREGKSPLFGVVVRSGDGQPETETHEFDFVVICNGVFSKPNMPNFEGRELFEGRVLHTSELIDAELVSGQRIVVVGGGKSAVDCATLAAQTATSCTLAFHSPPMVLPQFFWGIRTDRLLMSRFSEFFNVYSTQSRFEAFFHKHFAPLVRLYLLITGFLITVVLKTPPEMFPDPPNVERIALGDKFFKAMSEGRAKTVRGRVARFSSPSTLELEGGEQLEADVVVCGTGWQQETSLLEPELQETVRPDGRFHLYRHILPPTVPELGFVGYASSTANMYTCEMAAHWLSQCFRGEMELPNRSEMDREINRVLEWGANIGEGHRNGYIVGTNNRHYADELLRDMGVPTRRVKNPLVEIFGPLRPQQYRNVHDQRRRLRTAADYFGDTDE